MDELDKLKSRKFGAKHIVVGIGSLLFLGLIIVLLAVVPNLEDKVEDFVQERWRMAPEEVIETACGLFSEIEEATLETSDEVKKESLKRLKTRLLFSATIRLARKEPEVPWESNEQRVALQSRIDVCYKQ